MCTSFKLFAALIISFSLAACGSSSDEGATTSDQTSKVAETTNFKPKNDTATGGGNSSSNSRHNRGTTTDSGTTDGGTTDSGTTDGGTTDGGTTDGGTTDGGTTTDPAPIKVSAVVSWNIPTTREDGSDLGLGEIGGYVIYYRQTSDMYYTEITVNDQTISEYEIADLDQGEYEFYIVAYDSNSLYSADSAPVITNLMI